MHRAFVFVVALVFGGGCVPIDYTGSPSPLSFFPFSLSLLFDFDFFFSLSLSLFLSSLSIIVNHCWTSNVELTPCSCFLFLVCAYGHGQKMKIKFRWHRISLEFELFFSLSVGSLALGAGFLHLCWPFLWLCCSSVSKYLLSLPTMAVYHSLRRLILLVAEL